MTIIVDTGVTLDVSLIGSLTLTADSTIAAGGVLDGSGIVTGPSFTLLNQGLIETTAPVTLTFDTGPMINDGTIHGVLGAIALPSTVTGTGTIETDPLATIETQAGDYAQTFVNNGRVLAPSSLIGGLATITGQYIGAGILTFASFNGSMAGFELASPFAGKIDFGTVGEVVLDAPLQFTGTVTDMVVGDAVVFKGLAPDQIPTGAFTMNVPPPVTLLRTQVTYFLDTFYDSVNNNTTLVLDDTVTNTICFRAGTRIATPDGDVTIESLVVGDPVMCHFAGVRHVVWIGQRTIDCRRHPNPAVVLPVRIAAGAFGPGLPRRDLFLSPGHALFFDGVLIPVKCLINDHTIVQMDADAVTYFHVELDEHDVLLAEGLPAESYLDTGNRAAFVNGGPSRVLFPDLGTLTWEVLGCAPLIVVGEKVTRLRDRLAAGSLRRAA